MAKVLRAISGDPTPTIGSQQFWLAETEAVLGIWKSDDETNRDRLGRDKTMRTHGLSYALMRMDVGGVHYAVLLDARQPDA